MSATTPSSTSQWEVATPIGTSGLQLKHDVPIPSLKPHGVLVCINACSLNSRDSQILNNKYLWGSQPDVVPLSDCAGSIVAKGDDVTRFEIDARVCATFHRQWLTGPLRHTKPSAIGALEQGVLRQYAVFNEDELVAFPSHLSFVEASTLPCAAVTAWNALFSGSRCLKPGDVVLTQGSGGVSLFAIQFARVAGATVIATTSKLGGEKEKRLNELGAKHVLSYKDDNWGEQVKALTPGKRGVDFIVEVSGATEQSAKALQLGGSISVIGGFAESGGSKWNMAQVIGEVRRAAVGSRSDFEEMNKAIEANGIKPIVDAQIFEFERAKEAYEYDQSSESFGKVVIVVAE